MKFGILKLHKNMRIIVLTKTQNMLIKSGVSEDPEFKFRVQIFIKGHNVFVNAIKRLSILYREW